MEEMRDALADFEAWRTCVRESEKIPRWSARNAKNSFSVALALTLKNDFSFFAFRFIPFFVPCCLQLFRVRACLPV